MRFEWDEEKAAENERKHGISFDEAATVFGDHLAMTYADPDHSIGEQRFLTFGHTAHGWSVVVAHTDRDDKIRLISAREMTRKERQDYEQSE